ncbi:hypothetical protein NLJ89_g11777 [Agrocybe chaxingu]|uniref:Uncharacterized protein n=1 Tax=Agrocybe chaxingu TaxID=84603 RepID=A0A9W8JN40_9AGAR|nr:hypothetical protein NLJ89_g11777 [Agrocybe chaxingu]
MDVLFDDDFGGGRRGGWFDRYDGFGLGGDVNRSYFAPVSDRAKGALENVSACTFSQLFFLPPLTRHDSDRLERGPTHLMETVAQQADLANVPRVGSDTVLSSSRPVFKESLGNFAGNHLDRGDADGIPTGIMVFSEPHPDIEELFCFMDSCAAWKMTEFATLMLTQGRLRNGHGWKLGAFFM